MQLLPRFTEASILFVGGLVGIIALIFSLPLDTLPQEVRDALPREALPFIAAINPTVLLAVATTIGFLLARRVGISAPLLSVIYSRRRFLHAAAKSLIASFAIGAVTACLMLGLDAGFGRIILADELARMGASIQPSIWARLLYGGITEEVMMRYGVLSLLLWAVRNKPNHTTPFRSWFAIGITAIAFGLAHLPIVFQSLGDPSPMMIFRIILLNSLAGFPLGWLALRRGIEFAMVCHIGMHICMIALTGIIS